MYVHIALSLLTQLRITLLDAEFEVYVIKLCHSEYSEYSKISGLKQGERQKCITLTNAVLYKAVVGDL